MGLVLCATCVRHVKRHEHQCPFCGAALAPSAGGSRVLTAAVMIGIGLAVGACGGDTETGVGDGGGVAGGGGAGGVTGSGGGTMVPLYAAVVPDSGAATGGSAGKGGATAVPLYKAVPLYAAVVPDSGSAQGGSAGAGGSEGSYGGYVYIYSSVPF
jgi:hypothetical protein